MADKTKHTDQDCNEEEVAEDRVYSSRKFVLALICIIVISLGGLVAIKAAAFAGLYPSFIGGVLGVAGLYISGNVANDFLNNKVKANIEVEHIKTTGTTTINATKISAIDNDIHQDGE